MKKLFEKGLYAPVFACSLVACVSDSGMMSMPDGGTQPGTDGGTNDSGMQSAPFHLTTLPPSVLVKANGMATFTVKITRDMGFNGAINFSVSGLPMGVTAGTATAQATDTSVMITLSGGAMVAPSANAMATVTGTSGGLTATANESVVTPGAPGTLDTSFGTNGIVSLADPDGYFTNSACGRASAAVLQTDGKIVIAGSYKVGAIAYAQLTRLNVDGTLDTTFGMGGKTITAQQGGVQGLIHAVALQSNGSIVVAGETVINSKTALLLARYDSTGKLDTTFGMNGVYTRVDANTNFCGSGLMVQSSGKAVVTGTVDNSGSTSGFGLRLTTGGAVDNTFGTNNIIFGLPIALTGSVNDVRCFSSAPQQNDAWVIGCYDNINSTMWLQRFDASGKASNFLGGNSSIAALPTKSFTGAYGLTATANDLYAVGGSGTDQAGVVFVVFDNIYGQSPQYVQHFKVVDGTDYAHAVVTQSSGAILVGGGAPNTTSGAYLARVTNAMPMVDTTFGAGGYVKNAFGMGANPSEVDAILILQDDRIVAVGNGVVSGKPGLYAARYWP